MIERRCHLGRVAFVFSLRESTRRTEKEQWWRRNGASRPLGPRRQRGRCYLFGMIDQRNDHERVEAPFWASCLRYSPGIILRSGGTQTGGGAIVERRRHFCRVAFVCAPPGSASRADKTNASEEIERRGARAALPLCFRPAGLTEQTGQNEPWQNAEEGALLFRSRYD